MARTKLQNTSRYPTSIIVRGAEHLGIEIAKSLLEQGGFVIIIDHDGAQDDEGIEELRQYELFELLDYTAIAGLEDELQRLDYVFYLNHDSSEDVTQRVPSQEFLQFSNYLDSMLNLTAKFEAKFLLTTAVKAHQMILANKSLEGAYFSSNDDHTIYNKLEMQRYAESLVKEYQQNVNIDSRIIRLGSLLGKGIEIETDSPVIKMIIQGLNSENLKLPGDGLESDFYIHHLDAAYGILKAQFSLNTNGKIFTLANQEEITLLSIAYKLLELIPDAKEIHFNSDDDSLPPLKLYKPAENLTSIGWKPRVNFERALGQTVDYVKDRLDSMTESKRAAAVASAEAGSGFKSKLKDFFFEGDDTEEATAAELEDGQQYEGALARLIAERKQQEKARKGSVIMANSKVREHSKPIRKMNFLERIGHGTNKTFASFKRRFYFLKHVTLADFVIYLIGSVAFAIIYFLLISPLFSLGRNVYFIKNDLSNIAAALDNYDYVNAISYNENLQLNLVQAQERLGDLEYIFRFSGQSEVYKNAQLLLTTAIEYSDGYQDIFTALGPITTWKSNFKPDISYTFAGNDPLTLATTGNGTSLSKLDSEARMLRFGLDKLEKSDSELEEQLNSLPEQVRDYLAEDLLKVTNKNNSYEFYNILYQYLPQLLGVEDTADYLLIIQDNARYTAGGGEFAGAVYLQLQQGKLTVVDVIKLEELELDADNFNEQIYTAINLYTSKDTSSANLTLADLSLIADSQQMQQAFIKVVEDNTDYEIDAAATLNLSFLENYLAQTGSIEYQELSFSDDTLLSNINTALGTQETQTRRNDVIINLFSIMLSNQLRDLSINFPATLGLFRNGLAQGNVAIAADNSNLMNMLEQFSYAQISGEDVIEFGINAGGEQIKVNKYGLAAIGAEIYINEDLTTEKNVVLDVSGVDAYDNSYICSPFGSKNLVYSQVEDELVTTTLSTDKVCSIFLRNDDLKYEQSYDTVAFDNVSSSRYNYQVTLKRSSGIDASYTVQFTFDPALEVTPADAAFIKQGDSFVYSGIFSKDTQTFSFEVN